MFYSGELPINCFWHFNYPENRRRAQLPNDEHLQVANRSNMNWTMSCTNRPGNTEDWTSRLGAGIVRNWIGGESAKWRYNFQDSKMKRTKSQVSLRGICLFSLDRRKRRQMTANYSESTYFKATAIWWFDQSFCTHRPPHGQLHCHLQVDGTVKPYSLIWIDNDQFAVSKFPLRPIVFSAGRWRWWRWWGTEWISRNEDRKRPSNLSLPSD